MARLPVTAAVMGQKSAEAVVGADAVSMRLDGWKQAGEEPRKPYPAEGPNEEYPIDNQYKLHNVLITQWF